MNYENMATAISPALVIFVLDMSGSMGDAMPDGKTRIDAVKRALHATATEMVQRSLRNRVVRPRYRVAMIGYSDDVYDILKGVQPIDAVAKMGIPKLPTMNRTNTAKALRLAKKVLEDEIARWPLEVDGLTTDPEDYPAPLVIHMTDGEYTESTGDPEPVVREIQQIAVPDGNVLVENIFVSDGLPVSTPDAKSWPGYTPTDDLGNPYANKLLSMSSLLPPLYSKTMQEMGMAQVKPGTAMMFPGIDPEFVKLGFVMSMGTSTLLDRPKSRKKKWEDE